MMIFVMKDGNRHTEKSEKKKSNENENDRRGRKDWQRRTRGGIIRNLSTRRSIARHTSIQERRTQTCLPEVERGGGLETRHIAPPRWRLKMHAFGHSDRVEGRALCFPKLLTIPYFCAQPSALMNGGNRGLETGWQSTKRKKREAS